MASFPVKSDRFTSSDDSAASTSSFRRVSRIRYVVNALDRVRTHLANPMESIPRVPPSLVDIAGLD